MSRTPVYLVYASWLLPLLLPFVFVLLRNRAIDRKVAFVLVGVFACAGSVWVSMFFGGYLSVWMATGLGLMQRGRTIFDTPALMWFNAIFMLAFNLGVSVVVLAALAKLLSPRLQAVRASSISASGRRDG